MTKHSKMSVDLQNNLRGAKNRSHDLVINVNPAQSSKKNMKPFAKILRPKKS
jgi:hypothetical protein